MYEFYKLKKEEIMSILNTSEDGLSQKEVLKRQKEGLNIIPKPKSKSILSIFFEQLKDSIVIILLISSLLSFLVGEKLDAIAILVIILFDLILGTVEEYKAKKSAESLQKMIKFESKVIRNGKEELVDSSMLVKGDILLISSGDKIPADLRVLECSNLTVDESMLTGESIKVEKTNRTITSNKEIYNRNNILYAGTNVITGRAKAVVIEIAGNTEIGKIALEVNNRKEEKTPLTIRTEKFSKQISIAIVIISVIIAIFLKQRAYSNTKIFISIIALCVSAMPEGLPLAFTMALTIGSNRMLKKNVIIKKLDAVESLGSCSVIATDKTGTLTVNEQTAKKILLPDGSMFEVSGTGYNYNGEITSSTNTPLENINLLIESTSINNEAVLKLEKNKYTKIGDEIDVAFLALGKKYKIDISNIVKKEEIPYESENKYSFCIYEKNNELYATAKGSIEKILEFSNKMIVNGKSKKIDKEKIMLQNEALTKEGYRVIAVATSKLKGEYDINNPKDLDFLGLVAFIDPIRSSVPKAIKKCKKAGIKVVMITGDHPLTAFNIAKELKLADYYNDIATSEDIEKYLKKSEVEFDNFVRNKTVFARITPIQKLKIVESFKRQGEFVAVTGDGVNDAPAIKSANVGIAMGSGTDVAKEVASMIIKDDDFKSIVEGIEEGRIAYSNIRKICYFLLSCGLSEVLFFILSLVFNVELPLVAIQLLWINLVTDGLQDLALSFEKKEKNIMTKPPMENEKSIFDKDLISEVIVSGLSIGIIVFIVWFNLLKTNLDITTCRSCVLMLMVFMENFHVLNCRSEKESIFKIKQKNMFVAASIIGAIILQLVFLEVPTLSNFLQINSIDITKIIYMFMLSIPIIVIMELYKVIRFYNPD